MLSSTEFALRHGRIRRELSQAGVSAGLFTAPASLFYLTGAVSDGFFYLDLAGNAVLFLRRPAENRSGFPDCVTVRKPEQIPECFTQRGITVPEPVALEGEEIPYSEYLRLAALFQTVLPCGSAVMRRARMVKTPDELRLIRESAAAQKALYEKAPLYYRPGMTDLEFSAALEYEARKAGHLGIFRTFGFRMEAFMGSLLAGENAAVPSPYDFALGGGGHASLPMGACGQVIRPGMSVMVDLTGNQNGYQSDCSRTFFLGTLPAEAIRAHDLSIRIQHACAEQAKPGVPCRALYETAMETARAEGFSDRFMGRERQAGFIGHGLGIQINELPVFSARCEIPLETGMVFALEPKFLIDRVGAVGTENTYVMTETGAEQLTTAPEALRQLGADTL